MTEPDIRDERREAAARALYEHEVGIPEWKWDDAPEENRDLYRAEAVKALAAADAVTRPDWIIEAWRQEVADAEQERDEARAERDNLSVEAHHWMEQAARYREALERIRDGRWNVGRKLLSVREFAREALGGGDDD